MAGIMVLVMFESVRHLYIHIPFCAAKCPYCAFVTHIGSQRLVEPYLSALAVELRRVAVSRPGGPLESVYFGGGTPGLLTGNQVARVLETVDDVLGIAPQSEITLEAHPDTAAVQRLQDWKAAGINRLSIGVESMVHDELIRIHRSHRADGVRNAVRAARRSGFDNISLDLIYGLPGQDLGSWDCSLQSVLALTPDHLSLYPLSIEPLTVFARQKREGRLELPADELVVGMYDRAVDILAHSGYVHYEVANWSRPGSASRHNLAYWYDREYYGVGIGAHAYLKPYRTENEPRLKRYLDLMERNGDPVVHREYIGTREQLNESIMLGLRLLREGLDLQRLRQKFGHDLRRDRSAAIEQLIRAGLLDQRNDRLYLPDTAVPVANEIWERLIPA